MTLDWRQNAACITHHHEDWFPPGRTLDIPADHHVWDYPRAICHGCDVRAECLTFALDNDLNEGMFGGKAPIERRHDRTRKPA